MTNDLISRTALLEEYEWLKQNTGAYNHAELDEHIERIKNAPAVQPVITGETSDGYHTFNELYHHRAVLFSVIVKAFPERAWKARKHHDGTMYEGMFIVGIETPEGQATYHYDIEPYWDMFNCPEREFAPEWDGHTAAQAIERIGKLEPVRNGKWVESWHYGEGMCIENCYECSECRNATYAKSNCCPNCGAKMDGDKNASD